MKKWNEWVRKALKREKKGKDRGIVGLMRIMHHFFMELPAWIDEMKDPRHPSYITYSQSDLFYMGLMKNICGVKTMHSMEKQCIPWKNNAFHGKTMHSMEEQCIPWKNSLTK